MSDASQGIDRDFGVSAIGTGGLVRVESGSHQMAHNTPDSRHRVDYFDAQQPLEIPTLKFDGKNITSGEEARAILSLTKGLLKKNDNELAPLESFPRNPQRKRLLSQKQSLENRLEKAERFLTKWERLDNDENLKSLIDTNDSLAEKAAQILALRKQLQTNPDPKQAERLGVLSEMIRNALVQRKAKIK